MANSVEIPAMLTEKALEFIQRRFQNLEIVRAISPAVRDALFNAELEPLQIENRQLTNIATAASEIKDCRSQLQTRDFKITETAGELLAATNLVEKLDAELRRSIAKYELDLEVEKDKVQQLDQELSTLIETVGDRKYKTVGASAFDFDYGRSVNELVNGLNEHIDHVEMISRIGTALEPVDEPYDVVAKIMADFGLAAMRYENNLFFTDIGSSFVVVISCRMPNNVTLVAKSSFKISADPKFIPVGMVPVLEVLKGASLPTLEFPVSIERPCSISWWFDYVFPKISMPLDVLSMMAYLKALPSLQDALKALIQRAANKSYALLTLGSSWRGEVLGRAIVEEQKL